MPGPVLETLFASLASPVMVPVYHPVAPEDVPEPFHQLLVHDRHMTVAMETYHHCKVAVRVLQSHRSDQWYARQILLHPVASHQIVLGGIVRIHLHMLDPHVQAAILREDTPLGHVLIQNDVLRHIEVTEYIRFDPCPALGLWPGFDPEQPAYGRLGILYCDLQPAIELFEIIPANSLIK